jgi:hypothetical protein
MQRDEDTSPQSESGLIVIEPMSDGDPDSLCGRPLWHRQAACHSLTPLFFTTGKSDVASGTSSEQKQCAPSAQCGSHASNLP